MIGLYPIVRNKAFDMVSDGNEFKLSAAGEEQVLHWPQSGGDHRPSSPLDTLRPQAIYDALLLQGIDPRTRIAVLESEPPIDG